MTESAITEVASMLAELDILRAKSTQTDDVISQLRYDAEERGKALEALNQDYQQQVGELRVQLDRALSQEKAVKAILNMVASSIVSGLSRYDKDYVALQKPSTQTQQAPSTQASSTSADHPRSEDLKLYKLPRQTPFPSVVDPEDVTEATNRLLTGSY